MAARSRRSSASRATLSDHYWEWPMGSQAWRNSNALLSDRLRLFSIPKCHYPGLLILDFPPELEDGSSVRDKENFILEPFVELLAQPEFENAQVIAAGSSFENLNGANRI